VGNYCVSMYIDNQFVQKTNVYVSSSSVWQNNFIYLSGKITTNSLAVGVNCYYPLKLDWGDKSPITDVPVGQDLWYPHDYRYVVGGSVTYTIYFDNIAVANVVINDNGEESTFTSLQTNTKPSTEIISWTNSPNLPTTTVNTNNWDIGNYVLINVGTTIYNNYRNSSVITTVNGSLWSVKLEKKVFLQRYYWWKISCADGTTGWIRQDLAEVSNPAF